MSPAPETERRSAKLLSSTWLVPLLLIGLVVLYFAPLLFGQRLFPSDGQLAAYHAPVHLWSSAWATGWPVIGDPLQMPLYPIRVLLVSLGVGFDGYVASAYILALLGMFWFLRCHVERVPAAFGALAFCLSGWALVHLGHTSMVHAGAWLPWIMLGVQQGCCGSGAQRLLGTALLGVAVAMGLAAGHAQITVYSMLLAGVYSLYLVLSQRVWSGLLLCAGGVLLGVALAAPVLLPAVEWTGHTLRSELNREELFSFALPLSELPGLLVPLLYGSMEGSWFGVAYRTPDHVGETLAFLPTIGVLLCLLAVLSSGQRRTVMFFAGYGVLALALALGDRLALAGLITEHLFLLDMFRAPSRHLLELTFCFSVLSAMGLQALLAGRLSRGRVRLAGLLLVLLLLGAAAAALAASGAMGMSRRAMLLPLLCAVLAVAAALGVLWLRFRPAVAAGLALLLLLGQTLLIGYQLPWRYGEMSPSVATAEQWTPELRRALGNEYRGLAMDGWLGVAFNPDASRLHGVNVLGWYGPLLHRAVVDLTGLTNGGWTQRYVLDEDDVTLDLLSVRYVSLGEADRGLVENQPERWRSAGTHAWDYLYENARALPRARLVCRTAAIADEAEFIRAVRSGNTALSVTDTAYTNTGHVELSGRAEDCQGQVRMVEDAGHVLRMQVEGITVPSLLVLSDLWYPGWTARVDGEQKLVLRVNNISRGVLVEPGATVVELSYWPTGWGMAIVFWLIGVGLLLALVLVGLRERWWATTVAR